MRFRILVVSVFSVVATAGAQGTTPSDTTKVANVRNKADNVTTVAVTSTATVPTATPKKPGYRNRVVRRKAGTQSTPAPTVTATATAKTVTQPKVSSSPVPAAAKTKTEAEINAENEKLEAEISASNVIPPSATPASAPAATAMVAVKKTEPPKAKADVTKVHTGHPFARATNQLGLVNAIRTCDRKVLIARCDDLLDEFNRVTGERFKRHFSNRDELAEFIASAEEGACPVGEVANLSRVLGSRVRVKDTWERAFEPGERCLYVDNLLVLSLRCGNPAKSTHYLRAPRQEAAAAPSKPVRTEPKPRVVFIPPSEPLGSELTPEYRKRGWSTTKKVVVGGLVFAALAEGACLIDDDLCLLRIRMHQSQRQSQK
jgi:hypothetical protein